MAAINVPRQKHQILFWHNTPVRHEILSFCGTLQELLGAQSAPSKIQEVTLMRPFHGNLE